jgi:hypothetical protein
MGTSHTLKSIQLILVILRWTKMRDKTRITISVPHGITREEVNNIRKEYQDKYKDCIINILISGQEDLKENLYNFIKTRINS